MNVKTTRHHSILLRLDFFLLKLESLLALIGGVAVFSLLFLAVISVSGRNILNSPLPGYIDWIEQIMPLIAFMGASFTLRSGNHIRMDMLVRKLTRRNLWIVELFTTLLIFIFMVLIVWGSSSHFLRSFDITLPLWSRDSSMDIALPIWPAKLIVPVAFTVLCIRLFFQLIGYIIAIYNNSTDAVGIAEIEDISMQAKNEASIVTE